MLGDWLLTLCALVIILVEEIYKFFRYRLNLERVLVVSWKKMCAGIGSGSISPWPFFYRSWFSRLGLLANQDPSGPISIIVCLKVLFSTTVSLAATLVTDFVENLQPETKSDGRNRSTNARFIKSVLTKRRSLVSYWPLWFSWWLPSCLPNQEVKGSILQGWFYNLSSMLEPCSCMDLVDESIQRSCMKSWNRKGRINAL